MAKQESLARNVTCSCGASGKATWTENENPAHANWQTGASGPNVSGPFEAIDEALGEAARFRCNSCGELAELGRVQLVRD